MLKGIIFDFDGVIVESIDSKSRAFSQIYSKFGRDIIKKVVSHHENNGGMSRFEKIKYYHKEFLHISLSDDEILKIANKFSKLVIDEVIVAPYVPGVMNYIKKLYNKYQIFISTGTPTDEIKLILKARKIDNYFKDVFGSPAFKDEHIKQIFQRYRYNANELKFFGDSYTDKNAAENASIPFILVKNSYNYNLSKEYKGQIINNFLGFNEN